MSAQDKVREAPIDERATPCPIEELREAILDVAPELEALPGFDIVFGSMLSYVRIGATCMCCAGLTECEPDCTIALSDPEDFKNMQYARSILAGAKL